VGKDFSGQDRLTRAATATRAGPAPRCKSERLEYIPVAANARNRMPSERVRVLVHRQGERTLEQALVDLWRKVEAAGWLATVRPRVLLQVGQRWRSKLVVLTAGSLARSLAHQAPPAQIEILDVAAQAHSVQPDDEEATPTLTVSGIAA